MGFALGVVSKVKRIFSSPAKEKSTNGANPLVDPAPRDKIVDTGYEFRVKDFGSKEEMFFDSRVWLDSDCEDDYCSVKGEFTPSRGSTPNHQFGGLGTSQRNGKAAAFDDLFPDTKSESSPSEKKKKLAELLQDSLGEQEGGMLKSGDVKVDGFGKSGVGVNGKPATYEVEMNQDQASSEGTPKPRKERTRMAAACCMSGLVPGIISRKQKMSPAR